MLTAAPPYRGCRDLAREREGRLVDAHLRRYLMPASLDEAFDAMERHRGAIASSRAHRHLPWAREGRAGDVDDPGADRRRQDSGAERAPASMARACASARPRRSSASSTIPRLPRALPCHAALRGVVRRRPDPGVRHHRRQHRQCLAGRRRHAAADRARGAAWSWRRGATARSSRRTLPLAEFVHRARQDRAGARASCWSPSSATRSPATAAASRRSATAARW